MLEQQYLPSTILGYVKFLLVCFTSISKHSGKTPCPDRHNMEYILAWVQKYYSTGIIRKAFLSHVVSN